MTSETREFSDEQILAYENQVKSEFQKLALNIATRYTYYRAVRKDGNCFYRAFLTVLAEKAASKVREIVSIIENSKEYLLKAGYDLFAVEDFHEMTLEAFKSTSPQELDQKLKTDYISDTIVCYFRLLTAAKLREEADHFSMFLSDEYQSIDQFISQQVEPMNLEADNIQIVAISKVFNVKISIVTLDASKSNQELISHQFVPDNWKPDGIDVTLLFKPGHYDILQNE